VYRRIRVVGKGRARSWARLAKCRDHERPGAPCRVPSSTVTTRSWASASSIIPGVGGQDPNIVEGDLVGVLAHEVEGFVGGPAPSCRRRVTHSETVAASELRGLRARRRPCHQRVSANVLGIAVPLASTSTARWRACRGLHVRTSEGAKTVMFSNSPDRGRCRAVRGGSDRRPP